MGNKCNPEQMPGCQMLNLGKVLMTAVPKANNGTAVQCNC